MDWLGVIPYYRPCIRLSELNIVGGGHGTDGDRASRRIPAVHLFLSCASNTPPSRRQSHTRRLVFPISDIQLRMCRPEAVNEGQEDADERALIV